MTASRSNPRSSPTDGNFPVPQPKAALAFTGERMTTQAEGQIEFEHFHRYCLARDLCKGLDVLDVASGEGYGSAFLAGVARSVVGVEIDGASVVHASANYRRPNLRFVQGDALALPLAAASVDVVVSFETLEHVADQARFFGEVKRVLRPHGWLIVSTPDRAVYSAPGRDPNPFHVVELTAPEFGALLASYFANTAVMAQRSVLGSVMAADRSGWRSYERRNLDRIEASAGLARGDYLIGVASDAEPPAIGSSVYIDWRGAHYIVEELRRIPALEAAHRSAQELIVRREAEREDAQEAARRFEAAYHTTQEKLLAAETRAAATRDVLLSSSLWAATQPPDLARRSDAAGWLSRAGRLAWWAATLQLGRRFRDWRIEAAAMAEKGEAEPGHGFDEPAATEKTRASDRNAPAGSRPGSTDLCAAFAVWHGRAAIFFPPVAAPEVSIIIPAFRGLGELEACLRSIAVHRETEPSFEVIVVDDCPADPVLPRIPDSGGLVKLANAENLGFLHSCNRGAQAARGAYLCFLNSDTIVTQGWLATLINALKDDPRAGLAGSMLLNRDGTIQDAGWRILGDGWGHPIGRGADPQDGAYTYRRRVDSVSGACFAVSRAVWDMLGGFDAHYAPAFYEEFDLAFRAKARGLHAIYEPRSRVIHLGSASYGPERRDALSEANHGKFCQRFEDVLRKQPGNADDAFAIRETEGRRPVILVVDSGLPRPNRHAGDVTMFSYLSLLTAAGWRVIFAPMDGRADEPEARPLERQGIEVIRAPQTIPAWLARHGRHLRWVWLARPDVAHKFIRPIRNLTSAKIAYYTHDLHHLRLEREAALRNDSKLRAEAAKARKSEADIFRRVDHVTSPNQDESALIRNLASSTPVTTIPAYFYRADEVIARDEDHFAAISDIVFVGGFPHTPNVDAALFIAHEIMPLVWHERPAVRLVLIGYAPPPGVLALASERVVVTGQVPDLAPFFDRARLVLAALRYGAGIKGKVVDALRRGVPVVTTSVGAEGIGIESGHHGLIADDPEALATAACTLLDDAARCAALSAAGAELVRARFSRAEARGAISRVFAVCRCGICGSEATGRPVIEGNARETVVCDSCFALARTEALGRVLLSRLAKDGEGSLLEFVRNQPNLRLHEFGVAGGIANVLRGFPNFSQSDHFLGIAAGSGGPGGVRCENLTDLTFEDESLDVAISQDVLDHVSDPARAFAEIARVLRPGGRHFFSVPWNRDLPHAVVHAQPGTDLDKIAAMAGCELAVHHVAILGGTERQRVRVFEAIKTPPIRQKEAPDVTAIASSL